jgi:ribonuclease BN (tRNA processing enzyme)
MATYVAKRAKVKRLVLFHHDPTHDDAQLDEIGAAAQKLFPNATMAYEGLTIKL